MLLGVLPFFHSFGFTVTLWLPAFLAVGVAFHPSPIDLVAVSEMVRDYKVTFLADDADFFAAVHAALFAGGFRQFAIRGGGRGEDCRMRLALAFEDRFGIRPLEGYGATECSPVIAVNTRDFRAPGFLQVGAKRGRIGHPLPGIAVRIVDPETRERLAMDTPGLLLVRGPNVMKGYLGKPEKTAEVLQDGWYIDRRHCGGGRGWIFDDYGPAEPLQQDRRRNGAAHQDRRETDTNWPEHAGENFRGDRRAGRKERRAAGGAAHAGSRRGEAGNRKAGEFGLAEFVDSAGEPVFQDRGVAASRERKTGPAASPRDRQRKISGAASVAYEPDGPVSWRPLRRRIFPSPVGQEPFKVKFRRCLLAAIRSKLFWRIHRLWSLVKSRPREAFVL